MLNIQDFLIKPSTQRFLKVAREFVTLLEEKEFKKDFYSRVHSALLDLYQAGHHLEQVKHIRLPKELQVSSWDNKDANLILNLGDKRHYYEIFNPVEEYLFDKSNPNHQEDIKGLIASLDDDFSDIYKDLKGELYKIEQIGTKEAIQNALWTFKWGFYAHWGNHCIDALRCLHYLDYEGKPSDGFD